MRPGDHKDITMPFGKHKGELLCDLPDNYISWLLEQDWVITKFTDITKQLKIEKEFRIKFDVKV